MQSTKQRWDWRIQETLVKEVLRLDPENEYIKKWCNMENHHGANIRKARDYYLKHGKSPEENGEHPLQVQVVYNENVFYYYNTSFEIKTSQFALIGSKKVVFKYSNIQFGWDKDCQCQIKKEF